MNGTYSDTDLKNCTKILLDNWESVNINWLFDIKELLLIS